MLLRNAMEKLFRQKKLFRKLWHEPEWVKSADLTGEKRTKFSTWFQCTAVMKPLKKRETPWMSLSQIIKESKFKPLPLHSSTIFRQWNSDQQNFISKRTCMLTLLYLSSHGKMRTRPVNHQCDNYHWDCFHLALSPPASCQAERQPSGRTRSI